MYWFLIAIQRLLIGWTLGCRWSTSALLQKLLIGLKILHRWNWCAGRCWCTVVIWIKYFGDKHTNPSWWRQTTAIQIMATWLQAPCYFDSLREIAFVWNLDHISPGALIILCKHRRCIFYFCGARGWWTFVPAQMISVNLQFNWKNKTFIFKFVYLPWCIQLFTSFSNLMGWSNTFTLKSTIQCTKNTATIAEFSWFAHFFVFSRCASRLSYFSSHSISNTKWKIGRNTNWVSSQRNKKNQLFTHYYQ